MKLIIVAAIALVILGCCCNVVLLEFIINEVPGAGNLITFCQFLFIASDGFIRTSKFGTVKSKIPIRDYLVLVTFFFVVSTVNNYALYFNISLPLHMIFKSGSLIANLLLGILILNRKYNITKYVSVITITVGIIICTIASARDVDKAPSSSHNSFQDFFIWIIGISMLIFALVASARMGIYQEQLYAMYGKHASESLFYNHVLPLPFFILLSSDIYNQFLKFNNTSPLSCFLFPHVVIPKAWLFLLGNVLTQYVCIRSVFILTTECTSLTVTLVITLRKFLSLLFSIWYFQNPFTMFHWFGTILVFGGTLMFTNVHDMIFSQFTVTNESHKNIVSGDKQKTE